MRLLLDSRLLLWAALTPRKLPEQARILLADTRNILVASAASLWEITIEAGLGRADFRVDPHLLRRGLVENGYEELAVTPQHVLAVAGLPDVHRDPFDRLLIAPATTEGIQLVTHDSVVQAYPGPIRAV